MMFWIKRNDIDFLNNQNDTYTIKKTSNLNEPAITGILDSEEKSKLLLMKTINKLYELQKNEHKYGVNKLLFGYLEERKKGNDKEESISNVLSLKSNGDVLVIRDFLKLLKTLNEESDSKKIQVEFLFQSYLKHRISLLQEQYKYHYSLRDINETKKEAIKKIIYKYTASILFNSDILDAFLEKIEEFEMEN